MIGQHVILSNESLAIPHHAIPNERLTDRPSYNIFKGVVTVCIRSSYDDLSITYTLHLVETV